MKSFATSVFKKLVKGQKAQKARSSLLALRGELPETKVDGKRKRKVSSVMRASIEQSINSPKKPKKSATSKENAVKKASEKEGRDIVHYISSKAATQFEETPNVLPTQVSTFTSAASEISRAAEVIYDTQGFVEMLEARPTIGESIRSSSGKIGRKYLRVYLLTTQYQL